MFKVRKSSLFIAAGAAVFLCGCPTTKVTGTKTVVPAPLDDPAPVVENKTVINKGTDTWEAPETKTAPKTVKTPAFEPMTGVVSSGGIDCSGKGGKKSAVKGGKVSAAGGVYTVKSGDTPERIARKHGVRVSALMAANNLDQQSARRLQIGQKLTIPGRNAKVAPAKKSAKVKKSATVNNAAPAAVDADGKYTIQSGDTPERIARKHRVRLSELLKANNLDQQSARRLQIGQKLVIPGKTAAAPEATTTVDTTVPADNTATTTAVDTTVPVDTTAVTTPVVTGETAISETVTTTPTDGGDVDSEIQMVTIEADTTAAELAVKYNVSAESISQKNSSKTEFLKGDIIFIPKK